MHTLLALACREIRGRLCPIALCMLRAILAEGLPEFILVRREGPVVAAHTRSHAFVLAERACTRDTPVHNRRQKGFGC